MYGIENYVQTETPRIVGIYSRNAQLNPSYTIRKSKLNFENTLYFHFEDGRELFFNNVMFIRVFPFINWISFKIPDEPRYYVDLSRLKYCSLVNKETGAFLEIQAGDND